jgi:hypothetical protein
MVTRQRAQNSVEASRSVTDGTNGKNSGPPRFLFFFRGRRSVQAAGSRSKENGALEFWLLLTVALALIIIVALICLRSIAAVR